MSIAIWKAKSDRAEEVTSAHLLEGCLRVVARFGVATIGSLHLDLTDFEIDWLQTPERAHFKVSYSDVVVTLLDQAARIAKSDNSKIIKLDHLLVALGTGETGPLANWMQANRITNAQWRAAVATLRTDVDPTPPAPKTRDYLSPEDAAEELGIHVQTVRAYVRSGKLPAQRIAGERAIRIRREDLPKLMEPMHSEVQ